MSADQAWFDQHMPDYQFRSEMQRNTAVDATRVLAAVSQVTVPQLPISAILFAVRGIPLALRGTAPLAFGGTLIESMQRLGFVLLHSDASLLAIGLAGRFWQATGDLAPLAGPEAFDAFCEPGYARAAVTFAATSTNTITTETRIQTFGDAESKFRRYWRLVKIGSQFTRWEWLRAAERLAR